MNSVITIQQVLDELGNSLDDENSIVFSASARMRAVQRAYQAVARDVLIAAPSMLRTSVTIPYVSGWTEYPLIMTPRVLDCGTTLSTTVTSAALFLSTDVGANITGVGIPTGATISGFTSTSSITISAAATIVDASVNLTITGLAANFVNGYQAKWRTAGSPAMDERIQNIKYSEVATGNVGWYIREGFFGLSNYPYLSASSGSVTLILDYNKGVPSTLLGADTFIFDDQWASLVAIGAAARLKEGKAASDAMVASARLLQDRYDSDYKKLVGIYSMRANDKSNNISSS